MRVKALSAAGGGLWLELGLVESKLHSSAAAERLFAPVDSRCLTLRLGL